MNGSYKQWWDRRKAFEKVKRLSTFAGKDISKEREKQITNGVTLCEGRHNLPGRKTWGRKMYTFLLQERSKEANSNCQLVK